MRSLGRGRDGSLIPPPEIPLPNPGWQVRPPAAPGDPPDVRAEFEIPNPEGAPYGPAYRARIFKVELEREAGLDDLLLDNPETAGAEVEVEWELLQARPGAGWVWNEAPVPAGTQSVVRRYEFYRYDEDWGRSHTFTDPDTGRQVPNVDPESGEVQACAVDGCNDPTPEELGRYVGPPDRRVQLPGAGPCQRARRRRRQTGRRSRRPRSRPPGTRVEAEGTRRLRPPCGARLPASPAPGSARMAAPLSPSIRLPRAAERWRGGCAIRVEGGLRDEIADAGQRAGADRHGPRSTALGTGARFHRPPRAAGRSQEGAGSRQTSSGIEAVGRDHASNRSAIPRRRARGRTAVRRHMGGIPATRWPSRNPQPSARA